MEIKNNYLEKVITLDGPAGSGKSTIAKMLAKEMGYYHIDSGAIYRAYTYAVIKKIGYLNSPEEFGDVFLKEKINPEQFSLQVYFENDTQIIKLDTEILNEQLRTRELTERIKYIADNISYRYKVNQILRDLAVRYPVIVDGRDMGTEVFPESRYKFYIDASIEVRAKRRYEEYIQNYKKNHIDIEEIKKEIQKRDEQDKNRKIGALKIPEDAIIIDTSNLTRNMVLNLLLTYLQKKF
ncbi:MAG: cytidylate kinase [Leptospiraceae bacterium]|nr:MAG: cytidylate kinase [Leptospiraceae bacterium]